MDLFSYEDLKRVNMMLLITFLENWKEKKTHEDVFQIPTIDLLLEELKEQYGTDRGEPEKEEATG